MATANLIFIINKIHHAQRYQAPHSPVGTFAVSPPSFGRMMAVCCSVVVRILSEQQPHNNHTTDGGDTSQTPGRPEQKPIEKTRKSTEVPFRRHGGEKFLPSFLQKAKKRKLGGGVIFRPKNGSSYIEEVKNMYGLKKNSIFAK